MTKDETINETVLEAGQNLKTKKEKKDEFKISNLTIWRVLAYFILYSIGGYIIETIFGIVTKGVWESRQSFMYRAFLCYLWTRSNYYYYVIA